MRNESFRKKNHGNVQNRDQQSRKKSLQNFKEKIRKQDQSPEKTSQVECFNQRNVKKRNQEMINYLANHYFQSHQSFASKYSKKASAFEFFYEGFFSDMY